jgi:TRAP transporter TAXI family solute receptor
LHGRRVGVGKIGAGYAFTREVVLGAYGWTILDFEHALELDPTEQEQALCSNRVDGVFFESAHPNGLTQGVTTGCRARLVRVAGERIDRLLATHSFYFATVIPGGMYPGNPDDVATIGTQAMLVTTSDQPNKLAYAVVKAVFENFADFRRLHPALSTLEIRDLVPSGAVIPIHPGALTYYREAGLVH